MTPKAINTELMSSLVVISTVLSKVVKQLCQKSNMRKLISMVRKEINNRRMRENRVSLR